MPPPCGFAGSQRLKGDTLSGGSPTTATARRTLGRPSSAIVRPLSTLTAFIPRLLISDLINNGACCALSRQQTTWHRLLKVSGLHAVLPTDHVFRLHA